MYRVRLFWDSAFEMCNATRLGNHLWGEIPSAVKLSPIIFVICLVVISVLFSKGCDKDSQISTLKSDKDYFQRQLTTTFQTNSSLIQSYQLQFSTLSGDIREKEGQISGLIQERDKAQLESQNDKNALAAWIMLAKSENTNTPLTERLDLLAQGVEENTKSLTNVFGASISLTPKFDVSINGEKIPNGSLPYSVINLKNSRSILISIANSGDVAVDKLTTTFGANLDRTNLTASGWDLYPPGTGLLGLQSSWKIIAQDVLGSGDSFNENSLLISTNYNSPAFLAKLAVTSPNSKRQQYVIIFILGQ